LTDRKFATNQSTSVKNRRAKAMDWRKFHFGRFDRSDGRRDVHVDGCLHYLNRACSLRQATHRQ